MSKARSQSDVPKKGHPTDFELPASLVSAARRYLAELSALERGGKGSQRSKENIGMLRRNAVPLVKLLRVHDIHTVAERLAVMELVDTGALASGQGDVGRPRSRPREAQLRVQLRTLAPEKLEELRQELERPILNAKHILSRYELR